MSDTSRYRWRRFSLRNFLGITVFLGCGAGLLLRWYTLPYRACTFFKNGHACREWWQRRELTGRIEILSDSGYKRYYSNGVLSCQGFADNPESNRYFSPSGTEVPAREWRDYFVRDLGDSTFAPVYPSKDGRESPLAQEFDQRPASNEITTNQPGLPNSPAPAPNPPKP